MKKVLLTGASGFIGKHTIPFLLSEGYEIHAITRTIQDFHPHVTFHKVDLFDENKISKLLSQIKATHLLHFAWYTVHGKYWSSEFNLDCVRSSLKLFQEFIAQGGQRIVAAGSCAEYTWGKNLCDEFSTPLKASTLYGSCKASLYQLLEAYCQQKNVSFAWGRIFFLYGPHESKERLVPSIILKLLKRENAPCSHGHQIRDFLYVEDVAHAFVSLLSSDIQGAINIASGEELTLRHIIDAISTKLDGRERIQYGVLNASSDPPVISANIHRLKNELKWSPTHSLENGLDLTIEWWKNKLQTSSL